MFSSFLAVSLFMCNTEKNKTQTRSVYYQTNKEKQKIITVENWQPGNVCYFSLKTYFSLKKSID